MYIPAARPGQGLVGDRLADHLGGRAADISGGYRLMRALGHLAVIQASEQDDG
jgi:hypothetical protein